MRRIPPVRCRGLQLAMVSLAAEERNNFVEQTGKSVETRHPEHQLARRHRTARFAHLFQSRQERERHQYAQQGGGVNTAVVMIFVGRVKVPTLPRVGVAAVTSSGTLSEEDRYQRLALVQCAGPA